MKNKNLIFHELKEISPLIVQIKTANVYSVSSSYFNDLSSEIIEKIKREEENFNVLSPVMPYQTPRGYFESLPAAILKKVDADLRYSNEVYEETALIAPVLNTISKEHVYFVPADFFAERLMSGFKARTQKVKIIPFYKRSNFKKLSVAAVVASLLAVGLYTITGKDFRTSAAYINAEKQVKNLSKEEIVNFLKTNSSVENITSASPNANKIKSSLKKISDKEIQQYLKETGEADDI